MTLDVTDAGLYGQGISFPPRIAPDGSMVWSAGELNVRECICTLLLTLPGERVEMPAYGCGLRRYLYEPNSVGTLRLISEDVQRAITRWEPRVRLDGVTATVNTEEPRAVDVSVSYTLVSTGTAQQLRVTVGPDGTGTGAP
jgi:Bacteriophage baseplate protein W